MSVGYGLESVVPEMSQNTDIVTVGGMVRGAITSKIPSYRERRDGFSQTLSRSFRQMITEIGSTLVLGKMPLDLDQVTEFGKSVLRKDSHGRKHSKPRLYHSARCIFFFSRQEPYPDPLRLGHHNRLICFALE